MVSGDQNRYRFGNEWIPRGAQRRRGMTERDAACRNKSCSGRLGMRQIKRFGWLLFRNHQYGVAVGIDRGGANLQEFDPALDGADQHHHDHRQHDAGQGGKQDLALRDIDGGNLEVARPHGDPGQEQAGNGRDPGVLGLVHPDQHRGADNQGARGQQLVAHAEERPDGGDVAGVDQVTPGAGEDKTGADNARPPGLVVELGDNGADHFLEEETADPSTGVNGGQDEHGFKHDGKVVPVRHQPLHEGHLRKDVRHADGQRHRAAWPAGQVFLNRGGEHGQILHLHAQFGEGRGRGVDGEIIGRHQGTGGNEGHDGHKAFGEHRAIADEEDIALVADHLRRGAGADDGVEPGDRAAGDGDEHKGNDRAADDGAAAVGELGDGGHQHGGLHHGYAAGQHDDRADLQIGGQIVARAEQQPDRQYRGEKAVNGDRQGNALLAQGEDAGQGRMRGHIRADENGHEQQGNAEDARALHVVNAPVLEIHAHDKRDGNGGEHGKGAPGALEHRVHHRDGQARQGQDEDEQHGPGGDNADGLADLLAGDVGQAAALVAHRGEQHDHVVHRAGKHRADENPQRAGQIAELRGKHRSQQGAGGRYRRKVMAVQVVLVGLDIILPVREFHGGRRPRRIQVQHLVGDKQTVGAVGYRKDAHRHKHQC